MVTSRPVVARVSGVMVRRFHRSAPTAPRIFTSYPAGRRVGGRATTVTTNTSSTL